MKKKKKKNNNFINTQYNNSTINSNGTYNGIYKI